MGELARLRRGRELHLATSHVIAAGVGVVLLCLIAFGVGVRVGEGSSAPERAPTFTGMAAGDDLVELLARVESSGDVLNGVDRMVFPNALTQSSGGGLVSAADRGPGRFHVEVAVLEDVADARQLRDHLRAAEAQAWVAAEIQEGMMHWRVSVGGFASEEAALDGKRAVHEALGDWQGVATDPTVVAR